MRKENSMRNIKNNLVFFIINSILIFLSKTVLIKFLGAEYTGLNSVFTNILNFMNVAELGITSAVTYSLYKPLKDQDYKLLNSIVFMFKEIYKIIGIVITCISLVFLFFINDIVKSNVISKKQIIIFFIIYALKVILSYYITYLQIIAVADQKSYIITKISGVINIIKICTQMILVIVCRSYLIWLLIEISFTIFSYIIINYKIRSMYKWIVLNQKDVKKIELFKKHKDIFMNTKNLVFHKIGRIIVYQTDNILLSIFTNLTTVAVYGNYTMITNLLNSLLSQVFNGIRASVGNLIAEDNNEKVYKFWEELSYISFIVAVIVSFCFYVNVNNLIEIWLGKEFIVSKLIVLTITLNMFFLTIRNVMDMFKDGYGLFWDIHIAIVEAIINFIFSIILVKIFGLIGVIIGTVISNLFIVIIWQPYMIYRYGFNVKMRNYLSQLLSFSVIAITTTFLSNIIIDNITLNINNKFIFFTIESGISLLVIILNILLVSLSIKKYRDILFKYINIILDSIGKKVKITYKENINDSSY